jgi:hypothetical protein
MLSWKDWTMLAGGLHVIEGCLCRAIGSGSGKVLAQEHRFDGCKGWLRQQDLCHPVPPSQAVPVPWMPVQVVRVGSLDAMHTPGVLGLAPAKEPGGCPATPFLEIGDLQGVEMPVLGVGDSGLSAKVNSAHRHTVARVGVSSDGQSARFIDNPIGGQDIGRGAHLGCARVQQIGRHVQFQEQMLQSADSGSRRKNRQDVKSQGGRKLETWQHQELVPNMPVLIQLALLVWLHPSQFLQQIELLNLRL